MFKGICFCKLKAFVIRPYTLEFIKAIHPFFEIIGIARLPYGELS